MNPTQLAAEAAAKCLIDFCEMCDVKVPVQQLFMCKIALKNTTTIIQSAIEKGIQAWLCDKGWQGKTFEPIIKKGIQWTNH